jgi:hypothetical protein
MELKNKEQSENVLTDKRAWIDPKLTELEIHFLGGDGTDSAGETATS